MAPASKPDFSPAAATRIPRRTIARAATGLLLTTVSGVLIMSIAPAATTAEQHVLEHLRTTFNVKPDAVQVMSITPRDLPPGALEFYVETRGSHGHDHYNYVVLGNAVYCSRVEGEFARLLREQSLLGRKDVGAAHYMRLYSLFALPRQLAFIDANTIGRNASELRAFPQVQAPALVRRSDGGATLVFFATPVDTVQPSKWTVSISPSYDVSVTSDGAT
jgi:hypothetical protein